MPANKPLRTPGSFAVAIVVSLMFVTPVLAATTLRPVSFRWNAFVQFVASHQFALILGFSLMIVIAWLLKTAANVPARSPRRFDLILADPSPHGIDGLA